MAKSIRMKTRLNDGVATIRAIIRHPMETGFRVDEESQKIVPAHYIKTVTIYHNDTVIMSCNWSRAVSKNPYLSLMFEKAKAGDTVKISWVDNRDKTDAAEAMIQ